jgi:hypothetical protein
MRWFIALRIADLRGFSAKRASSILQAPIVDGNRHLPAIVAGRFAWLLFHRSLGPLAFLARFAIFNPPGCYVGKIAQLRRSFQGPFAPGALLPQAGFSHFIVPKPATAGRVHSVRDFAAVRETVRLQPCTIFFTLTSFASPGAWLDGSRPLVSTLQYCWRCQSIGKSGDPPDHHHGSPAKPLLTSAIGRVAV